jgi:hypothetical protein
MLTWLAALAIEHGLVLRSSNGGFAQLQIYVGRVHWPGAAESPEALQR